MTAKDLRKPQKKEYQPCYVCGKHSSITHLHHTVPLKMCADLFNKGIKDNIQVSMVWLCPNCHAYVHKAMKHHNFNNLLDILREKRLSSITDEEVEKIKELSLIPSNFAIEIAKGLDDFSDPVLKKYGMGK